MSPKSTFQKSYWEIKNLEFIFWSQNFSYAESKYQICRIRNKNYGGNPLRKKARRNVQNAGHLLHRGILQRTLLIYIREFGAFGAKFLFTAERQTLDQLETLSLE